MLTNKLSLAVLLAGVSAVALTGCGGSSSSGGNGSSQNTTYTDTGWSVGSDELVGLTYPQGAENGPLVALKRSVPFFLY